MGQTFNNAVTAVRNGFRRVAKSWNSSLAIGSSLKRTPMRRKQPLQHGGVSLARGNLQRFSPLKKRSDKRAEEQKIWNEFTAFKVAQDMGCARCDRKDKPEYKLCGHHYLPKGRGGKSTFDNHVLICNRCHVWIHFRPAEAEAAGLLAPSKQTITPVQTMPPSQRGAA